MSMSIADEIKLEICSRKRALSSAFGSGCSSFSNFVFVSIRNLASHEGHNLTIRDNLSLVHAYVLVLVLECMDMDM